MLLICLGALVVTASLAALVLAERRHLPDGWSPPRLPADLVVARVHGETIGWAEVEARMQAAEVMGRAAPRDLAAWRDEASLTIDSIVDDVLIRHEMEAQGVSVTEAMIAAEIAFIRERYGGEAGLAAAMDQMRVSMAQLEETQRRGLYLQALIDRVVPASDADIDAYLAQATSPDLDRAEIAARVRADRAAEVIPRFLADLRQGPGIWVIDVSELG